MENNTMLSENSQSVNDIVLSFSGGMDSTCLLLHYLAQSKNVTAVSFKYGQNHSLELKRADKIIKQLKKWGYPVEHRVVDLTSAFALSASELIGGTVPAAEYDEETQKKSVVENRNIIFSSIIYGMALSIAKRNNGRVNIAQGVHSNDNSIYPDCRPESVNLARELYKISNWGSEMVDFETPFVNITKAEVLKDGLEAMKAMKFNKPKMKKILGLTISCYNPGPNGEPCGECGTCRDRAEAFEANHMEDPSIKN